MGQIVSAADSFETDIVLIPHSWQTISCGVRLMVRLRKVRQTPRLLIYRKEGEDLRPVKTDYEAIVSSLGTVAEYVTQPLKQGAYVAHFVENRFNRVIAQRGFHCVAGNVVPCLSLDGVESLLAQLEGARLIANGIGKSGTTWLWRLLGTLPGQRCIDMDSKGLSGIDHHELERRRRW